MDTLPSSYATEAMDAERCVELLRCAHVGRVVLSVGCLPIAVPAVVELLEGHVLVASPFAAVRLAAEQGDVVSVQVDGHEPGGAMWFVHVTGSAQPVRCDGPLSHLTAGEHLADSVHRGSSLAAVSTTHLFGERAWFPET